MPEETNSHARIAELETALFETQQALFTALDGILTIDERGIVKSVNPAAEEIFGYASGEIVGNNVTMLMPEPDRGEHHDGIQSDLVTGDPRLIGIGREVVGRRKDGSTFPMNLSVSEVNGPDRRYFTGIVRDITRRKEYEQRLEQREARLAAMLECAMDAIITIDDSGHIDSMNPAAERMFGYAIEDVAGSNVRILMPEPFRSEHDSYLRRFLETGEKKLIGMGREVIGLRRDGTEFPLQISVSEVKLKNRDFFVGIARDTTEEKRAREKAVRSERLTVMGEMISAVAHESRSALQKIQSGVDLLKTEFDEASEAHEDLERIRRAKNDLQRLLDELRNYAAPIVLQTSDVNIVALCQRVWNELQETYGTQDTEISYPTESSIVLSLDSFRMQQVIRNLMENSMGACSDPVRIRIDCHEVVHEGTPSIELTYRDNGPGLTNEHKERVFEPFFTTKSSGSGLGMAIASRVIEAHHGSITVQDAPGGGAMFEVILPRSQP